MYDCIHCCIVPHRDEWKWCTPTASQQLCASPDWQQLAASLRVAPPPQIPERIEHQMLPRDKITGLNSAPVKCASMRKPSFAYSSTYAGSLGLFPLQLLKLPPLAGSQQARVPQLQRQITGGGGLRSRQLKIYSCRTGCWLRRRLFHFIILPWQQRDGPQVWSWQNISEEKPEPFHFYFRIPCYLLSIYINRILITDFLQKLKDQELN